MKIGLQLKKINRWSVTDKMFMSLFVTGTIIEFSQVGAGFVDGLVISRFLGAEAMAAEGIVHPIYSIQGIISGLLAIGMQVKCAQSIGRGNRKEYCRFVSATVMVGVIISIAAAALTLVFAGPFVTLLGASGNAAELADDAAKYLTGLGIGLPPLIMTAVLAPALQLDTGRKTIQTGALIETSANILMDLIAVKIGWGIFGIGLATSIASYMNLLYLCTFFLKKDRILHFVKPDVPVSEFMKMLSNGGEKAIRRLANTLRPIILNRVIIIYGGVAAMSVLSVRNNLQNIVEIFGAGTASAVALLTGVYYGEINQEGIEEVNKEEHRSIIYNAGVLCVLMLIFARQIAQLYISDDGEILDMAVFAVRMLAVQIPMRALIDSRIKYLQAIQKKRNMNLLIFSTQLVFVLMAAFVLGKMYGSYGILACFTASDALTLIAVYLYYVIMCRKGRPTRRDFLNLPDYFYLNPGDKISLDIRNIDDVSLGAHQIMLFCKGHKIDPTNSYYASLAFEELASNIVLYGFPNNKSEYPIIEMRAVISENNFVLRLRDNCPQYDVTKKIVELNEEDADLLNNMGTRIVSQIADDITYLRTFDTNSLIIKFKLDKQQ